MSITTKNLRNICLLGHSGSGKTSFAETMLFEAGAISRKGTVDGKSSTSDYTNIEQEKGNSLFSTLLHAKWRNHKINILDTPGSDDFIGEVVSSLKVADTALMMINASNGVEVGTEIFWEYVQRFETPCVFILNQMDHEKADFSKSLQSVTDEFGAKVTPIQFPINEGNSFNSIVDALRMTMYVFPEGGGKPEKRDIPDSEIQRAQEMHNALVEIAAENDEGLMEKFFDAGSLTEEELTKGLNIALAHQQFYPVFCCSSLSNMGSGRIMGFLNDIAPSPADRKPTPLEGGGELVCDENGPTSAFIFKTISEPQVGMVSYFKVYSGKLNEGVELYNADNRSSERINQIFEANGKKRSTINALCAGDIGVCVKLKDSHTNNTLNQKGTDHKIAKIDFPSPRIRTSVVPPSKGEMEKLMKALHQIGEEDPTLIVEQNPTLKQTILHGQGQLHLDLTKYRIEKVNNISMEFEEPRIMYRETITKTANASYRHKKQSGGSGQFGEVHMRVEPFYEGMPEPEGLNVRSKELIELDWGGKLSFYWCIVGGSIDSKYINAIKKGVMQKMEEGPLTGSRCQDIRVCIYDGKMHAVDSNDMAFMIAASQVFKDAFQQAAPQVLEPMHEVNISCSDQVMGDVMGDLQSRRAMITGMDADGNQQKIKAKVPLAELYQYSSALRSLTQGKAKFSRKFSEFVPVTSDIKSNLVKQHQRQTEAA